MSTIDSTSTNAGSQMTQTDFIPTKAIEAQIDALELRKRAFAFAMEEFRNQTHRVHGHFYEVTDELRTIALALSRCRDPGVDLIERFAAAERATVREREVLDKRAVVLQAEYNIAAHLADALRALLSEQTA